MSFGERSPTDLANTAEAIKENAEGAIEGHFHRDAAAHNRGSLRYCANVLAVELAVLEALPWSTEEEFDLGLLEPDLAEQITLAEKNEAS